MEYETILQQALERVPEKYSKREDTAIYNAIAPNAYILSKAYEEIQENLKKSFGDTSYGIWLERIVQVNGFGMERLQATACIKKGEFKNVNDELMDIPIGARFAFEEFTFIAIESLSIGLYKLESEQKGSSSNEIIGDLLPIDNIPSLGSCRIIENIKDGIDIETDEHLRERYFKSIREPATSGNVYHYSKWALEVPGVGAAKVFPLHEGPGTVKVVIADTDMQVVDPALVQSVQEYIENVRPIGATITVTSASEKTIDVSAKVRITQGGDLQALEIAFKDALRDYNKSITFKAGYISYAKVGSLLLDTESVLDYEDLKLNNTVANIELLPDEIPVIGTVTLTVL